MVRLNSGAALESLLTSEPRQLELIKASDRRSNANGRTLVRGRSPLTSESRQARVIISMLDTFIALRVAALSDGVKNHSGGGKFWRSCPHPPRISPASWRGGLALIGLRVGLWTAFSTSPTKNSYHADQFIWTKEENLGERASASKYEECICLMMRIRVSTRTEQFVVDEYEQNVESEDSSRILTAVWEISGQSDRLEIDSADDNPKESSLVEIFNNSWLFRREKSSSIGIGKGSKRLRSIASALPNRNSEL